MRDVSPRSLATIDAEIEATTARLRELYDELRAAAKFKNAAIVTDFLAGKSVKAIAIDRAMTVAAVSGVLLRAGHTVKARRRVQQQAANRAVVERYAARTQAVHPVERQSVGSP